MLLIFLVLFLFLMIVLWCISDNFKFAVLNIYVLGKLKSRIKEGFIKVKIMDIAFQKFKNEEELKQIKDVFITEINKINDDYKFFMDPIDDARKKCPWFKFIYEDKFNACIKINAELERQCNDLVSRYKNIFS